MTPASLHLDDTRLSDICRRYGVSKRSLFGSLLHGSSDAKSDVDILVEFPPTTTPSLLELGALQQELAQLTGPEVDLKTPASSHAIFERRCSPRLCRSMPHKGKDNVVEDRIRLLHMRDAAVDAPAYLRARARADLDTDSMLLRAVWNRS